MRKILLYATLIPLLLASCKRYEVIVKDTGGNRLENAEVYLSYDSDPKPPMFVTDQNGVAEIPSERAKKGGWVSIVAAYDDASGRRFQGSHRGSNPSFPVTITVTPR
jgi:hypothetical protein